MSDTLTRLKARIIRDELARRAVADVEAVETIVNRQTTVSEAGEIVATDAGGVVRVGPGTKPTMSVSDLLDELAVNAPTLFAAPSAPAAYTGPNPFRRSSYNVTRQMELWRDNPELAQRLADEADFTIRSTRL